MRLAPLVLALAGCSGSPTTTATHPADEPPVAMDAALLDAGPVAAVPEDPDCTPLDRNLDVVGFAGDALLLCTQTETPSCQTLTATGELASAPSPVVDAFPTSDFGPQQDDIFGSVVVCTSADACTTLRPTLADEDNVHTYAVDDTGSRVVLLVLHRNSNPVALELWNVAKNRLVARYKFPPNEDSLLYDVGFVGDLVVMITNAHDEASGVLYKANGKKLVAIQNVPGLDRWRIVDETTAVFVRRDELELRDLSTGRAQTTIPWQDVLDDAERAQVEDYDFTLHAAADEGRVAFFADLPLEGTAAGVYDVATKDLQRYVVPPCHRHFHHVVY